MACVDDKYRYICIKTTSVIKKSNHGALTMKKKKLPKLTPAEFDIMDVVWQTDGCSIADIMERVNAKNQTGLKRTTFQVQVLRLEEKGWLTHRGSGRKFTFLPTVGREQASGAILEDVQHRIFGGSCLGLVRALFEHSKLSADEVQELKTLIDQYNQEK